LQTLFARFSSKA